MRCLQCGKRLPLFRKVDGDFCSAAHAVEYAAREQSAAIARLKHATQHDVKSQSLWERRRRLKNGEVPPAEMRGLVSLSLPVANPHRTFQRVLPNPRQPSPRPAMPAVDRVRAARMPWALDLVADLVGPVSGESSAVALPSLEFLTPAPKLLDARLTVQDVPAVEQISGPVEQPEPEVAVEVTWPTAQSAAPAEQPASEVVEPPAPLPEMVEPALRQMAIRVPEPRKTAVRIRRPYAQSTPLRSGRRPIVFVRLQAQPVEYECSDPVREPAGLVALAFGPKTAHAKAVGGIHEPTPAPARGTREFGHPVRLSALALLHTAVGLAALDGTLKPVVGARQPAASLPEAAPMRVPGKTPPPALPAQTRGADPIRGLGGTTLVPIATPAVARPALVPAGGIPASEPFGSPQLVCATFHPARGGEIQFTASGGLEPLPPSLHPRPRNSEAFHPARVPAVPVESEGRPTSRGGCVPPSPVRGMGIGLGSRLAGLDAPGANQPKHGVVRRPDAVPVTAIWAPNPPAITGPVTTVNTPAAGKVPVNAPAPRPAAVQAASPDPAKVDSQTGLAIVATPALANETAPPLAGSVAMVFEVRISAGEPGLRAAIPRLLPPDIETALPVYRGAPVKIQAAVQVAPQPDSSRPAPSRPDAHASRSDSPRPQARTQPKTRSAFSEPQPKPEPAFAKSAKAKRYVPVMAPTRPTQAKGGDGDPPMAQSVAIYAIVPPVRGSLAPRGIETGLSWRKRRQTAAIRYQPAIDKLAWVSSSSGPKLKPPGAMAEKNGGARFNLIDEIGVPGGLWHSVQRRWERAPAAAKWALPALLAVGLAVVALPSRKSTLAGGEEPDMTPPVATQQTVRQPKVKGGARPAAPGSGEVQAAPASTRTARGAEGGIGARIRSRAAVVLVDDFRSGLGEWAGEGNWARGWAYDLAGFVRPGAVGIYGPTMEMTDYRMELLGQIDRRSIGWIVRAADVRNYYAMKLVVAEAGPVPKVVLERYPVVRGVTGAVQRKNLHFTVRNDTSYRILTEVRGNDYAVAVQGSLVDSWTETRLDRGGVGLFSTGGDQARVRWISVTHQDDLLGKLCAFFAPPSLGRDRGANE